MLTSREGVGAQGCRIFMSRSVTEISRWVVLRDRVMEYMVPSGTQRFLCHWTLDHRA